MGECYNKKKLLKDLKNDVQKLDRSIRYQKYINFRNAAIRNLIDVGSATGHIAPFVLSFAGLFLLCPPEDKPFILNDKVVYANEQVIDDSNGLHFKKTSFDTKYDSRIELLSAWDYVDQQFYERTITSFNPKKIDVYELEEILAMSKDELEKKFGIISVETIDKDLLDESDVIGEVVRVSKSQKSSDEFRIVKEGHVENLFKTATYLYISLMLSLILLFSQELLLGKDFSIDDLKKKYGIITDEDLMEMRKILEAKKRNLDMVSNNEDVSVRKIKKRRD